MILRVVTTFLAGIFSLQVLAGDERIRILHVMSYHQSWDWNIEQFQGFKDAIGQVEVEYRVVELDTKRQSDSSAIASKVNLAKKLIADWQPDLLYTNDDNAQKYLAQFYTGTSLPIVFSGVNRDPSEYGFVGVENVTGVMEHEHITPSINLLRSISKDVHKIAVIVDSDPTWKGVIPRIRGSLKHLHDVEVSDWIVIRTFSEYKEKILMLQDKVDAIALLGVFNIKDEAGKDLGYEEVLKWTAENSQLPDFSFWETRIDRGTLCGVAVSGYEQGRLAGEMAKRILMEGVPPHLISMRSSMEGLPMLNLRRAQELGLNIDVQLLLNSTVKNSYIWEE